MFSDSGSSVRENVCVYNNFEKTSAQLKALETKPTEQSLTVETTALSFGNGSYFYVQGTIELDIYCSDYSVKL